jgi:hypothetical protein
MMRSLARAVLALFLVSGCSMVGARWYDTRRVPGYVVRGSIPLVVDRSQRALEADEGGYIDTMVLTVREELGEHGVEATIISPKPSRPPSPRVELIVRAFDGGDFTDAWLTQASTGLVLGVGLPLAGTSEFVVLCRAFSPSNQLMFEGVIKSGAAGTTNVRDVAEAVGSRIADGLTDAESTRQSELSRDPR